jgi:hypothetical protein
MTRKKGTRQKSGPPRLEGGAATLHYNIGTRVPMWKLFTMNGATGVDFAIHFHLRVSFPVEFLFADGNSTSVK